MEIVWYFSKKMLFGKVLAVFDSWQGFNKAPSPGKVWEGLGRLGRSAGHPDGGRAQKVEMCAEDHPQSQS